MADAQSSGNPFLITVPSYGDKALTNIAQAIAKSQGNAAQSNVDYTNKPAPSEPSKKIDDPAVDVEAEPIVYKPKQMSNSKKFLKFVSDWGNLAVASGLISPVYFDTYKYILQIPPPADNIDRAEFKAYVGNTAHIIYTWYVNAQYAGDLGQLGLAIEKSKPTYTPPEGFCSPTKCSTGHPPISIKETGLFILIVSLGLAGILAWKLGGRR